MKHAFRAWIPLCLITLVACRADSAQEARTTSDPARDAVEQAAAAFSGDSALAYTRAQMEFGPRVPGSPGHAATARWIQDTLARHGAVVTTQEFVHEDQRGDRWPLVNILGAFGGEGRPLLLVAHWDTRPWADHDPEPKNRNKPVPGANDGASGVAVLLEIARHLDGADLPRPVHVLLVDGEDLGLLDKPETYCQGSRYFARNLPTQYHAALVLDMVGDADLSLPVEYYSLAQAPEVVDWVWTRGERLAPEIFSRRLQAPVVDDHLPLQEAGIPAINIIDFDYWAWHTLADTMSQVSAASLGAVGGVVLSLVLHP